MRFRGKVPYNLFLILLSIGSLNACYEEQTLPPSWSDNTFNTILKLNNIDGTLDIEAQKIYFTIGSDTLHSYAPKAEFPGYTFMSLNGIELTNNEVTLIGDVTVNFPYELIAKKDQATDTMTLLFTTLPIMHIVSKGEIVDEPKVLSKLNFQYINPALDKYTPFQIVSYAGIETRGTYSSRYEKSSFGLELWKDENENDYSASLLNMRAAEDWVLDAMYIDDLRMRNKISNKIWENMCSLPEENSAYGVFPGIEIYYVELFINNAYQGLYNLNEKINENLLHFSENQYTRGGVLYKGISWENGSTRFDSLLTKPSDSFIWEGWEQIYPKTDTAWSRMENLRSLIVLSDDETFINTIASALDMKNAVDYYLFINLLLAFDNNGHNTFVASYSFDSPFFIMPWDTECSWGLNWLKEKYNPYGYVSNGLFNRLIETNANNYNQLLKNRWSELRQAAFSEDYLEELIETNYQLIMSSGAYDREKDQWKEFSLDPEAEKLFILDWMKKRLLFLDDHFK